MTALTMAHRFLGMAEVSGTVHNPAIVAMLAMVNANIHDDETPWCSAFVNYIAFLLGLKRSGSLAARSWLRVGEPVAIDDAVPGFCVVVFQRGDGPQPGPEVLAASGHVAILDLVGKDTVRVVGGNQGNRVSAAFFPRSRILGVREI
jgi:uncharacterized protein (TIGR02594 family)